MQRNIVQKLVKDAFGDTVRVVNITEMEKGASSRRYFRLTLEGGDNTVPASLVQMALPDDAMKSDEATGAHNFNELPFINVQRSMNAVGLPVPDIYLDATAEGHVLLEDLGSQTFNGNLSNKSDTEIEQWYNAAVDLLAQMHDAMWPAPANCFARQRSFDYALLRWELDHYREWGLEKRFDTTLAADIRFALDTIFDDFAKEIDALPKGFVHRDYQSRNLMVKHASPVPQSLSIIDFQDALTGPRTYDLVALLNDSYVDLPFEMQIRLIERYADRRGLPVADILTEFDLITVQRKLKDGGRFIFIDKVKNDPSFLPFVSKSLSRVKGALSRLAGHETLKDMLAKVDPQSFQ